MTYPSPLAGYYEQHEAVLMPFGDQVQIVAELSTTELEYAAIRKSVALLDGPHRGLLRITGGDRQDFLHRMLTNDCLGMQAGDERRMFLLSVKGRIMADLVVIHREHDTLVDTFVHEVERVRVELEKLLFGEDVQIENLSASHHRLSLHGPRAEQVRDWWREAAGEPGEDVIADYRLDETGEAGHHLWGPVRAFERFVTRAEDVAETFDLKHTGWLAYNMARIEGGTPLFHVDFGTDSLPHELGRGLLDEAVSFTKGCYRGQEVVARMESLGHPAKLLVGFRGEEPATGARGGEEGGELVGGALPVAGTPLRASAEGGAKDLGVVTSSTFSPMLGSSPVGFAIVKWASREPGTRLYAPVEDKTTAVEVCGMTFYQRDGRGGGSAGTDGNGS